MVILFSVRYNKGMENYVYYFLAIAVMVLSLIAQSRVQSVFNKYAQIRTVRGITGVQLANELLRKNGISMPVTQVSGSLTDHFDPKNQVVGLSQSVYNFDSVSALAVAAHEIGHVLQYNEDYRPMKMRTAILPVANIGCRIGPFLVIGGSSSSPCRSSSTPRTAGFRCSPRADTSPKKSCPARKRCSAPPRSRTCSPRSARS